MTFDGAGVLRPAEVEIVAVPADPDLAPTDGFASAEIHDDLTFELAGINGPRRLRVSKLPAGWALKEIRVNGSDITDTPMPFGTRDQSLSGVEVVLTSQITEVSGIVTDAGQPVDTVIVLLFAVDRAQWYPDSRYFKLSEPGDRGSFTVRGLPPGEYFIAAVDWIQESERSDEWQDPVFLESLSRRATKVTLTEGRKLSVSPTLIVR